MAGLDASTDRARQRGLRANGGDGALQSVSGAVCDDRFHGQLSKLSCILPANKLARKPPDAPGKIICVEVESLGELVKEWMRLSGLNSTSFARLVGHGVSRQNIDYLVKPPPDKEKRADARPRWIDHMARAMGATVDDLYALRMPPPLAPGSSAPPAQPQHSEIAGALARKIDTIRDSEMRIRAGMAALQAIDDVMQPERAKANSAVGRK